MKTPLTLLDDIRIASPCPAAWADMAGDDRVRHCAQCNLSVFDLSELTATEAVALIEAKEGHLCVRLHRRRDGTVITRDCPVGVRQHVWHYGRRLVGAVAACFAWLFLSGCSQPQPEIATGKATCFQMPEREKKVQAISAVNAVGLAGSPLGGGPLSAAAQVAATVEREP